MIKFFFEHPILSVAFLLIIVVVAFSLSTPNYDNLGFERVERLDSMLDRGGAIITSSIMGSAGLDPEFSAYDDIGYQDKVKIDVNGKTIKGIYFGYNTQDECHYVYLKTPFSGEKVYKISESSCNIYLN